MTAKDICALAFDEAGITFPNGKGNNEGSGHKIHQAVSNAKGTKEEKPFDLEAHDKQHHGGHYDGGECKYRENAVQNGLITREQAQQKTNFAGGEGIGASSQPNDQQGSQGEPAQITPEQILNNFQRDPNSIKSVPDGIKSEQPKVLDTPVGNIKAESTVQEAVIQGLSKEAESGNEEAIRQLNNLKYFNDCKEAIGSFQRYQNESDEDFVSRFNQMMQDLRADMLTDEQKTALTNLSVFMKNRIELDIGKRTIGKIEAEAQNKANNAQQAQPKKEVPPIGPSGLPEYVGADGKTYVDVSGLGFNEAFSAAMMATKHGKEFLDAWDKDTGRWQQIVNEHNSNSVDDQNRRASVGACANAMKEMATGEILGKVIDDFINRDDISETDKAQAMLLKQAFEASAGDPKKQVKAYQDFEKWAKEKMPQQTAASQGVDANTKEGLDEDGKAVYASMMELPTIEDLGITGQEAQKDPRATDYQRELDNLDQQRNEGNLDAKGYDAALRKLKVKYIAQGYNPDPPKSGKSGWSHNVPVNSLLHDISNEEQRSFVTTDIGESLGIALADMHFDAKIDGAPQQDSNETTFFVKLGPHTSPASIKKNLEAIKNNMGDNGVRLDTVVTGKPGYVAFHVPNRMQDVIGFGKFFEDAETRRAMENGLVPIPIGKGPNGKMMVMDLASSPTPHALIGGATKSGKSVQGHNIIAGLLMKDSRLCSPVIIDPKGNEFTAYQGIKGVGYSDKPVAAVKALLAQQNERRKLLKATGCRNIQEYNAKYPEHPMPYMPVVFDEMTQAFQNAGGPESELAKDVGTLARLARDTGISIIGLTQNADAKSIPSELRNQLGFRMAFRTQSDAASRDLLGLTASQNGNAAKGLKGAGDGYIKNADDTLSRFQAAFIPPNDINAIVKWRKSRDAGNLDATKRTPEDIANEEREARWQQVNQGQVQPNQPKNYTVDLQKAGNDPGTALQNTASNIIADSKNLTKADAIANLDKAYQHYLGSIPEEEGRNKLASAYNTIRNEMIQNASGHQYKPDEANQKTQGEVQSGMTEAKEPPKVNPEDLVSPEEAQQLAQRQAEKAKFDATHKRFHPDSQQGEEALENETYQEEAQQIYDAHEAGKLKGEKFRQRLEELDANHKRRLEDIATRYKKPEQGQSSSQTEGQNATNGNVGQRPQEENGNEAKAEQNESEGDPLDIFLNPTSEQRQQFAKREYEDEAKKILADFKAGKIDRQKAIELSKQARAKRDQMMGKSDEVRKTEEANAAKEEEAAQKQQQDNAQKAATVPTESHGKKIAGATEGASRGNKFARTAMSHSDFLEAQKAIPQGWRIDGGDNPQRDGNGNVWVRPENGGDGSYGWIDKNNQFHYRVNTQHPSYKGKNSPEAQEAYKKWMSTNLNEPKNRKNYMNIAYGTEDENITPIDVLDSAILTYFKGRKD